MGLVVRKKMFFSLYRYISYFLAVYDASCCATTIVLYSISQLGQSKELVLNLVDNIRGQIPIAEDARGTNYRA